MRIGAQRDSWSPGCRLSRAVLAACVRVCLNVPQAMAVDDSDDRYRHFRCRYDDVAMATDERVASPLSRR